MNVCEFSESYEALEIRIRDAMRKMAISEERFSALALEIYGFQRKWNSVYDKFCAQKNSEMAISESQDLRELNDWKKIPAVPQSAFKQAALRSFPESLTTKTFLTSGTTGETRGAHHFCSLTLYDEAILRGWDAFELPRFRQIILTPTPQQAPNSSLSHMMGTLSQRASAGEQHFVVSDDGAMDFAKIRSLITNSDEPVALLGTALAFLHWFENDRSIALPKNSFAFETGGYKGSGRSLAKADLYRLFGEKLGLLPDEIVNEYGMTELSSQFYTRGLSEPHRSPPWLRALIIDPETNREVANREVGIVRIFDLANLGSVLAIETRDLAIRRDDGFELLGRDPGALPRGCSRSADELLAR